MNKGETESRFITAPAPKSSCEVLKEADTDVQVLPNYSTPQKTDSYFNPKMKLNRQLIFCALAVLAEERKPIECLDAFGATLSRSQLSVKVGESEVETEEERIEHESIRESDSNILDVSSDYPREKHLSIQRQLGDLERLADLNEGEFTLAVSQNTDLHITAEKKPCPLCPEEKFKACYGHKLHRHLQNLHWKISVEFEGYRMCICHLPCRIAGQHAEPLHTEN